VGTAAGSWTIVGPGVGRRRDTLEDGPDRLELAEDGENFAEFAVPHERVDGSRREAYAVLLARLLPFKSLESTRKALALLRALTGSVYDAAVGREQLGAGDGRELDLGDLEDVPDLASDVAMTAFGWAPPRDLGPLLPTSRRLEELARLLARLLDVDDQLPDGGRFGGVVHFGRRAWCPARSARPPGYP